MNNKHSSNSVINLAFLCNDFHYLFTHAHMCHLNFANKGTIFLDSHISLPFHSLMPQFTNDFFMKSIHPNLGLRKFHAHSF